MSGNSCAASALRRRWSVPKKSIAGYVRGDAGVANLDAVLAILANAGVAPETVLTPAALKAAEVVVDEARSRAPGPHVIAEINRRAMKKGELMVEIGPDKAHYYYKFFETGVQPFEIDLSKGRSRRASGKRRRTRGNARALKFGEQFASHIQRGGMAARPWLRPALDSKQDAAKEAMGREFLRAILAVAVG